MCAVWLLMHVCQQCVSSEMTNTALGKLLIRLLAGKPITLLLLLLLSSGERVPCDGEVLEGVAALDESMLTGESVLVQKRPGAAVAGGTVVYEGPLTVRATATGAESTLAGGRSDQLRIVFYIMLGVPLVAALVLSV
jgi:P-type E1-E2 ATPase